MLLISLTPKERMASNIPGIMSQQFGTVLPCICNGPYPTSTIGHCQWPWGRNEWWRRAVTINSRSTDSGHKEEMSGGERGSG